MVLGILDLQIFAQMMEFHHLWSLYKYSTDSSLK